MEEIDSKIIKESALKKLYHWLMNFAEHPKGVYIFAFFAVLESFIFPLPVDPLLLAMGTAKPKRSLKLAAIGLVCSVTGGFIGYYIGFHLWDAIGSYFQNPHFMAYFNKAVVMFKENTFTAMFLSGFTFIPYKIFTISAGIAQVDLMPFFWGSVAGRGARFFLLGIPLYFFGEKIRIFIEKNFEKVTIVVFILIAITLYLLKA